MNKKTAVMAEFLFEYKGGNYLLSRKSTIIGLEVFHFCVRNGNRWDNLGIVATLVFN